MARPPKYDIWNLISSIENVIDGEIEKSDKVTAVLFIDLSAFAEKIADDPRIIPTIREIYEKQTWESITYYPDDEKLVLCACPASLEEDEANTE